MDDRHDLAERSGQQQRGEGCDGWDRGALPVRGECLRHAEDGLRDDRDRHDLQPGEDAFPDGAGEQGGAGGEGEHEGRGREREGDECGQRAPVSGAVQADAEPDLARGRAGKELAQRDQVGVGAVVHPASAFHDLGAEVAQVRDRSAEGGDAEPEEDAEHLPGGASHGSRRCGHGISHVRVPLG